MKLFRRRISRSAVLLFFNMVLVLVSALLVLVNMQARTELDESKRGFYSERASYLINEESSWEEIRDILLGDELNNGIIFKKDLEMEADTRGVFYKGDFKKLTALVGLAPYAKESGRITGKRSIKGGRTKVRQVLYMATVASLRVNPKIKAFYDHLIHHHKKPKVALVACMRKLLSFIHALLKNNTSWNSIS